MWESHPRKVLVGVDTGDQRAALRFAAVEARRRGCGVHLVHVLHPAYGQRDDAVDLEIVRGELRRAGSEVLARAAGQVREALGDSDLPVTSELQHGHVVTVLSEASAHASLVVVQRRHAVPLSHLSTMSVGNGVAARSHAPVVVVPHTWPDHDTAPVVVGVDDATESFEVIRVAMEAARLRGARVLLLHAWWYSEAYDGLVFAGPAEAAETARQRAAFQDEVSSSAEGLADLEVDVAVAHGRPADLLVDATAWAQLVVLGRHHRRHPWGSHLDPITRTVLREAQAPVLVVDPLLQQERSGS